MVSVNQTLNAALGDGSRSTHYRVLAQAPAALGKLQSMVDGFPNSSDIDVMAKGVTIPGIEHTPIEISIQGHKVPVWGKTNYLQAFSITFYVDDKHSIRNLFAAWIKAIDPTMYSNSNSTDPFDTEQGKTSDGTENKVGAMKDLAVPLTVQVMDFAEEFVSAEYVFESCYPVSVEGVTFDGSATSQLQEISVAFKCQSYEYRKGTDLLDMGSNLVNGALGSISSALSGGVTDAISGALSTIAFGSSSNKTNTAGDRSNRKYIPSNTSDIFDTL